MRKVLKMAINSNTVRVVYSDSCLDYHVTNGLNASILMKFMKGVIVPLNKYESKTVKITDDFSWKSDSDGSVKKINYVSTNLKQVPPQPKVDNVQNYIRSRRTAFRPSSQAYIAPTPRVIVSPPTPNRIEQNNKKNFGNLFGGNN